jgi:quercetin dioxygenase-like cupin family protein
MSASFLEFDVDKELEQLHREPDWNRGQNAKTLAKFDDFRVVLTALKTGARLPRHHSKGRISIQTVAGHLLVRADDRTFDLPVGTLLTLDHNLPHEVEALEESAFLLTIAWPGPRHD